ncbi:hypothetical protein [Thalassococcus sp. S3]|uniref:hypothetical protein n=1 Tax=Thalassococcus sp. S3 TaxID=2017482 RepID=UPI001024688E|nr:hypothetical protein [Thalassococcus sp. S3]QBF33563.1 hypothetical protein CFI11_20445 [Thalassococcus sp. S3]
MSFIRPELQDALLRWREVVAGLALMALGLYWALSNGILFWLGLVLIAISAGLIVIGVQRARFRGQGGGPGVVQVDEGQISYFGPLTGGIVATAEIERLALDPTQMPAHWVLERPGQPPLHIPVTAAGADALFDVFSTLPGLKTSQMLSEMHSASPHPVVIWERTPSRPAGLRLH